MGNPLNGISNEDKNGVLLIRHHDLPLLNVAFQKK